MKKSEILEISELNELECQVSYKVLNKRKDVVYKKDSNKLISCINDYLALLDTKKKLLSEKNSKMVFSKKMVIYLITLIITLFLIYFILTNCLGERLIINILSYLSCLLLISLSFLLVHFLNYKNDLILENEYLKITNEILLVEKIRDNCLKLVKEKEKKCYIEGIRNL